MSKTEFKPILNASLPAQFRQLRIALAREPGHPEGDAEVSYIMVAPLDSNDRIDAKLWKAHRDACRVVRQRPDEPDKAGHLVHRKGGGWAFHYDGEAAPPDEVGYHFADEPFVVGEYVSVNELGKMHTYRVTTVSYI
ncbi:MAG: hypothetical protein ABI561_20170 [Bradyrhizobium sp.]